MEGILYFLKKKCCLTIPSVPAISHAQYYLLRHQQLNLAPTLGIQSSVHTVSESNFLSTGT